MQGVSRCEDGEQVNASVERIVVFHTIETVLRQGNIFYPEMIAKDM